MRLRTCPAAARRRANVEINFETRLAETVKRGDCGIRDAEVKQKVEPPGFDMSKNNKSKHSIIFHANLIFVQLFTLLIHKVFHSTAGFPELCLYCVVDLSTKAGITR